MQISRNSGKRLGGQPGTDHLVNPLPVRETPYMYVAISRLIDDPAKQLTYGYYAKARYTEKGLGDIPYVSLELNAMARWRQEDDGTGMKPGPLTLLPIVLSQGSGTVANIHGRIATEVQEALHRRLEKWETLKFPGQLAFCFRDTLPDALEQFKDGSLDEITLRLPEPGWSRETMVSLADIMIRKLNVEGTKHPNGANVLIGLKTSKSLYAMSEGQIGLRSPEEVRFADVFAEGVHAKGLQLEDAGTYNVGGERAQAKLMFIRKPQ
jgi:hypothetical protein